MPELPCPRCFSGMVRPAGVDFPVRRCSQCQGTWLDLEGIKSQLSDPSRLWNALSKGGAITGFSCPACQDRPLSQASYGGSEIDWCPRCKGLFFDAGELDEIRSATQGKAPSVAGEVAVTLAEEPVGWLVGKLIVEAVGWVVERLADVT